MHKIIKDFIKEEKGQTTVEWIIILALILIVVIVMLTSIGKNANKKATNLNNAIK